jgi:hypothetical protein
MINGTAEQFQKFATDYNKMMMDGWSSWTKQTIQSDAFTSASGAFMDWSLATHKMMGELSGQVMDSMDIPKRSDLARLSAQVQAVESRLMDQDDQQEELRDLLTTLIKKIDDIPAPAHPPVQPNSEEPTAANQETASAKSAPEASTSSVTSKKTTTKKAKTPKATKKKESK